jgi:hypothetical protein
MYHRLLNRLCVNIHHLTNETIEFVYALHTFRSVKTDKRWAGWISCPLVDALRNVNNEYEEFCVLGYDAE